MAGKNAASVRAELEKVEKDLTAIREERWSLAEKLEKCLTQRREKRALRATLKEQLREAEKAEGKAEKKEKQAKANGDKAKAEHQPVSGLVT